MGAQEARGERGAVRVLPVPPLSFPDLRQRFRIARKLGQQVNHELAVERCVDDVHAKLPQPCPERNVHLRGCRSRVACRRRSDLGQVISVQRGRRNLGAVVLQSSPCDAVEVGTRAGGIVPEGVGTEEGSRGLVEESHLCVRASEPAPLPPCRVATSLKNGLSVKGFTSQSNQTLARVSPSTWSPPFSSPDHLTSGLRADSPGQAYTSALGYCSAHCFAYLTCS